MSLNALINFAYIAAAIMFIFGLKMLSSPATARKGNLISAFGMFLAVIITLLDKSIISYEFIAIGIAAGSVIGFFAARLVAMTRMPEMVALFNGFGGIASLLVGWAVYHFTPEIPPFTAVTIFLSVIIGGITFTGSVVAFGKLSEYISGKPILFAGQHIVNAVLVIGSLVLGALYCLNPAGNYLIFSIIIVMSLILGILAVIPIGGADMPVVISLLNSYSGLAACAAGFVIQNNILIVAGALVGASGIILTQIMCKAMNRSLANVLFSGFGATSSKKQEGVQGEAKPLKVDDAYLILEAAQSVVVVPGYGLAVAQAQHALRELDELLEANGCEVRYAIHPVAGRMPGHMNVLLAEANVPYDKLIDMDNINPTMNTVDVCLVVGANDVVNPAAREDESSPIYGMPIINVDHAKLVFVLKRSMATGFAGVQNPLFFKENTRMIFGDAKETITGLVAGFKNN
ncbi:MAG: NAD(P)(+) transhydrogenase (Re/Si-specific) subunit beta [Candidatus Auribacter fodinae]|jgi:NAD(P) transhydrogenase subunit beta|uniref:NAD(P) transhydrogenase subunit beta n=1 Tax=Candidatus Auribacter fodinae TaxID=2093366 RepID=A0A3A4QY86_9BACT|nr:MAG: NAD(P)(+) transhydrogenase (Re/Si-specific) subunit beta [Candidatus Auribacter fodinae]